MTEEQARSDAEALAIAMGMTFYVVRSHEGGLSTVQMPADSQPLSQWAAAPLLTRSPKRARCSAGRWWRRPHSPATRTGTLWYFTRSGC
jgi:hypothetical protein